jgi:hypothetical protein
MGPYCSLVSGGRTLGRAAGDGDVVLLEQHAAA